MARGASWVREITQRRGVASRIAARGAGREHRSSGVNPMQTLRASAIALPSVRLAVLVALLSMIAR
jgi:hypothetical protein